MSNNHLTGSSNRKRQLEDTISEDNRYSIEKNKNTQDRMKIDEDHDTEKIQSIDTLTTNIQQSKMIKSTPTNDDKPITSIDNKINDICGADIKKLRLEAIFYPKFENESITDKDIRTQMISNVDLGKGYVEVTLKHSGSLLLWSGSNRYYSKNSTDNIFTHTGEILLRQHFGRVALSLSSSRRNDTINNNSGNDSTDDIDVEYLYVKCSNYLIQNRLTLSFELVTSVLGDHGSIPIKDFLILTAIAKRDEHGAKFYDTNSLINFAQHFYLPHNDNFVFNTKESVLELFHLYDTTREVGLATDTVDSLSSKCQYHICSMYPHVSFQGDILEGIVIRYVSYSGRNDKSAKNSNKSNGNNYDVLINTNDTNSDVNKMKQLEVKSRDILLHKVPATIPPCYELLQSLPSKLHSENRQNIQTLLTTDIRQLYIDCNDNTGSCIDDSDTTKVSSFDDAVKSIIGHDTYRRNTERILPTSSSSSVHIETVAKELLNDSRSDKETKRIAQTIALLDDIKGTVKYTMVKETITTTRNSDGKHSKDNSSDSILCSTRLLCIVHVLFDSTHKEYREKMKQMKYNNIISDKEDNSMELFRGFCFELVTNDSSNINNSTLPLESKNDTQDEGGEMDDVDDCDVDNNFMITHDDNNGEKQEEHLMLKMKFLPYMVRTFGCRNGLPILKQGGIDAYTKYTLNLLRKWNVSDESVSKWQPFFIEWGDYALGQIHTSSITGESNSNKEDERGIDDSNENHENTCNGSTNDQNASSPENSPGKHPLNSRCYLEHYEKFSQLYFSGQIQPTLPTEANSCTNLFCGVAVVVSISKEMSKRIGRQILEGLHGNNDSKSNTKPRLYDANKVSEIDILQSLRRSGSGGIVCTCTLGDGNKIRKHFKKHGNFITVVIGNCNDELIDSSLLEEHSQKERKKLKGFLKAWYKSRCYKVISVPSLCPPEDHTSAILDGDKGKNQNQNLKEIEDGFVNDSDIKQVLDELWAMSSSVPKPDKRTGILVFFPGIPGCGKSTLCNNETENYIQHFVNDLHSSKTASPQQQQKPRNVILRMGDQVKAKYWPLVKTEKLSDQSSIYIADKNVPRNTWSLVGEICTISQGLAVPVIPDNKALKTTSIDETSIHEFCGDNSAHKDHEKRYGSSLPKHHYPFSLHYLAVCMLRVLERPPGTHAGKLDSATNIACLVVSKFMGFYRNISAETFIDSLKVTVSPTMPIESIQVPFFIDGDLPNLPTDLKDALTDSLNFIYTCELTGKEADLQKSEMALTVEGNLRSSLQTHRSFLNSITVCEEQSRKSFVSQVTAIIAKLDSPGNSKHTEQITAKKEKIKIVSIDICKEDVHGLLLKYSETNDSIMHFLSSTGTNKNKTQLLSGKDFIDKTHVTMMHCSQMDQPSIRRMYEKLIDRNVQVTVTGMLWKRDIAALSATVASVTSDQEKLSVPPPRNDFVHITVYCRKGTGTHESNNLPQMLKDNMAKEIKFDRPHILEGKISFWDNKTTSKQE